jgi:acetyl-CoA acyltransferase
MAEAVIVDIVRSAGGKRNGALSGWHPVDLAAEILEGLRERNDLDPALVDDVIMGCVSQVGGQAFNVARNAVLAAGWPESVPGTTIDRQCGSSQQALHFAAQGVMAGAYDIVIASGVEVMSQVVMGASAGDGTFGQPFGDTVQARYRDKGGLVPQGISAELVADEWALSRTDLDTYSARSHECAAQATAEGRFENEIVPVARRVRDRDSGRAVRGTGSATTDEGIRDDTTVAGLAELRPAFTEGGKVTAGNSSQICDGASAALVMSADAARRLGLAPRARFHAFALAGADPRLMLTAPIPATHKVLANAGLSIDDIDLVEINEAFASVVLAWQRELDPDMTRVNVNGGAIALGHPLGASGTKLMATLVNALERTGGRWGLQTMCEGGGMANATIVERIS